MSWEFLLTSLVIVASPGTGVLITLTAGLTKGRRAAIVAALGGTLGIIPHMVAAITGLAAVLHASAVAFDVIRYAGVAYLLYMAWQTLKEHGALKVETKADARSAWLVLRDGLALNLLNPKLSIFFVAFLPQFTDASAAFPIWVQFLVLGALANLMFSSADIVCVFLAGAVVSRMRRSGRAQRLMQRAGGTVLIGLGAHLAWQRT